MSFMISTEEKGTEFYYADRKLKKPVKCTILNTILGYPPTIIAKRNDNGEVFECYDDGCYALNEYDKAFDDAQIQEDRIIY